MKTVPSLTLTLFKMGLAKRPPTKFSPETSTNEGISPKNFLTFIFNHFGVKFQGHTWCQSYITKLEPRAPLKNIVFSS